MTSIVIPAHNEAAVIERTLTSLLAQVGEGDEVIVVCNGCTDRTAEIARRFEPRVTVVETAVASKANALNLGDQLARGFPRLYLDADVELAEGALARIERALASGPWLAASPEPEMDFTGASWAVRAYYRVWLALPYCRRGMLGAGAYALSEQGRRRFGRFPDLIADDGYVRALFKEHERGSVAGAVARVRAPADLRWLLKIKIRSRFGQWQLARRFPELRGNEEKRYGAALLGVLVNPLRWPAAAVYLYVVLRSRQGAKALMRKDAFRWEKDESARREAA